MLLAIIPIWGFVGWLFLDYMYELNADRKFINYKIEQLLGREDKVMKRLGEIRFRSLIAKDSIKKIEKRLDRIEFFILGSKSKDVNLEDE